MDLISREAVANYVDNMPSELTEDGRRMIRQIRVKEFIADCSSAFEGMTNGEVIISLYPNLKYTIQNGRVVTTIGVASSFDLDWWNTPYKAERGEIR
jgi:hypothetical protein